MNLRRNIYRKVAYDFMVELVKRPKGPEMRKTLLRQAELITILSKISGDIKLSSESIPKKIERVKHFLQDPKYSVLVFDNCGVGNSDTPPGPYTYVDPLYQSFER